MASSQHLVHILATHVLKTHGHACHAVSIGNVNVIPHQDRRDRNDLNIIILHKGCQSEHINAKAQYARA